MMERKQMIADVKEKLQELCTDLIASKVYNNKKWTARVKRCLAELGASNGYTSCAATENKEYENEWLYDLVWYREEDGFLIDVPLVVESEWGKNLQKDIKFDFEKLLVANSDVKLMICNGSDSQKEIYLEYFQKAVNVFPKTTKDDLFLIAFLSLEGNDSDKFLFYEIKKKEGRITEIQI